MFAVIVSFAVFIHILLKFFSCSTLFFFYISVCPFLLFLSILGASGTAPQKRLFLVSDRFLILASSSLWPAFSDRKAGRRWQLAVDVNGPRADGLYSRVSCYPFPAVGRWDGTQLLERTNLSIRKFGVWLGSAALSRAIFFL